MNEKFPASSGIAPTLLANHYPSLDGLRAVSISLVVISHLFVHATKPGSQLPVYLDRLGTFGVYVFFVISGFLITSLLLKEKMSSGNISLRAFYMRRVLRIFPLAYLYIVCILILNVVLKLEIPWQALAGAAFFVGNLSYFKINWYTGHYWSLSMEEQYYLVFPFLLKKFTRIAHWLVVVALAGALLIRTAFALHIVTPSSALHNIVHEISQQCDGVLVGSLLALLCFRRPGLLSFLVRYRSWMILALLVALLIHLQLIPLGVAGTTVTSVLIGMFLLSQLEPVDTPLFRVLNYKAMVLIGKLSFSIYIWQQLFLYGSYKTAFLWQFPQNLILLAIVSYCSYYFYERKFLQLKDRISARRKAREAKRSTLVTEAS